MQGHDRDAIKSILAELKDSRIEQSQKMDKLIKLMEKIADHKTED